MTASLLAALSGAFLVAADGPAAAARADRAKLQGIWTVTRSELNEREVAKERGMTFAIGGDALTVAAPGEDEGPAFTITALDPWKDPRQITLTSAKDRDLVLKGIYEVTGDDLKLCLASGTDRPAAFAAPKGPGTTRLYVLKRAKP